MAAPFFAPRRLRGPLRIGVTGLLLLTCQLAGFTPHNAGAAQLGLSDSGLVWQLGEVEPGRSVTLPGAASLTVMASVPWDLHLSTRVRPAAESPVAGGASRPAGAGTAGARLAGAGLAGTGSTGTGETGTEVWALVAETAPSESGGGGKQTPPTWRRVGEGASPVLEGRPPTGAGGSDLAVSLKIRPSWDDPPGAGYEAELVATLSAGESVLASYIQPQSVPPGKSAEVTVWALVEKNQSGALPKSVTLSILSADGSRVGEQGQDVDQEGWHEIAWTTPKEGLSAGEYRYRVLGEDGTVYGSGILRAAVGAAANGEGLQAPAVLAAAQSSAPVSGIGPAGITRHALPSDPRVIAERLAVAIKEESGVWGAPLSWEGKVINAWEVSVFQTQVDLCLPAGWRWVSLDPPWTSIPGVGPSCRRRLLGTLNGRSERTFRFSAYPWPEPLKEPLLGGVGEREYLTVRLNVAPAAGGTEREIARQRIPLTAEAIGLRRETSVVGVVFRDLNGSGAWEEGEPTVSGAEVVADGRTITQTTHSGRYRLKSSDSPFGADGFPPRILWARTKAGPGAAVPVRYLEDSTSHDLSSGAPSWNTEIRVDLPVPLEPHHEVEEPKGDGERLPPDGPSPSKRLFSSLEGHVDLKTAFDGDGGEGSATLRSHGRGSWGYLEGGVRADTGPALLPLDAPAQGGGAGFAGLVQISEADLEGFVDLGHIQVEGAAEGGPLETRRIQELRPSKPASLIWRTSATLSPQPLAPGSESTVDAAWRMGAAQGDLWACRLASASSEVRADPFNLRGEWTAASHRLITVDGVELDRAAQGSLTLNGEAVVQQRLQAAETNGAAVAVSPTFAWPFTLRLTRGDRRELSPSCGVSPKEGWRFQSAFRIPRAPIAPEMLEDLDFELTRGQSDNILNQLMVDAAVWPGEGAAYELAAVSRKLHLARFGTAFEVIPALRWGILEQPESASETGAARHANTAVRPAVRAEVRVGESDRLRLEAGPPPLYEAVSAEDVREGENRLAVRWQRVEGALRPWLEYEIDGDDEARAPLREAGVSWTTDFASPLIQNSPPEADSSGEPVEIETQISRRSKTESLRDRFAGEVRWRGFSLKLSFDGGISDAAQGSEVGLVGRRQVPYDKTTRHFEVEHQANPGERDGDGPPVWTVSGWGGIVDLSTAYGDAADAGAAGDQAEAMAEPTREPVTEEVQVQAWANGYWPRGAWRIRARRYEEGSPGGVRLGASYSAEIVARGGAWDLLFGMTSRETYDSGRPPASRRIQNRIIEVEGRRPLNPTTALVAGTGWTGGTFRHRLGLVFSFKGFSLDVAVELNQPRIAFRIGAPVLW